MCVSLGDLFNSLYSNVSPYSKRQREADGGGVKNLREVHVKQQVHCPGVRKVQLLGKNLERILLITIS